MTTFKQFLFHGSLFSGIGGFDLAAQWMGWENAFHCEINPFARRILQFYWPKSKSYEDIKQTDFTIWRGKIDVLTGGFPCQPYSVAGKRKGKEDDRHLWPEMLRAIREIQPSWVVGENVPGLINWSGGLVFEEVQANLEDEGYEVWAIVLPAAGVNAPHRRDRVWIVAYSDHRNDRRTPRQDEGKGREERVQEWNEVRQSAEPGEVFGNATDTHSAGLQEEGSEQQATRIKQYGKLDTTTPDTKSQQSERDEPKQREAGEQEQRKFGGEGSEMGGIWNDLDPHSERRQERHDARQPEKPRLYDQTFPPPENWEEFPTQPPVCHGDDGISARLDGITFPKWRNESIKAGGNAIVPQIVFQIFKAINEYRSISTFTDIKPIL